MSSTRSTQYAATWAVVAGADTDRCAPDQLLAMKVRAAQPTDAEDIATLCGILGLRTPREVEDITRAVFPGEPIPERAIALVADVLDGPTR